MFSDRASQAAGGEGGGVDPKEFQKYFERHGRFTAGMGTQYRASVITRRGHAPAPGHRLRDRHALPFRAGGALTDARPFHLGHAGKADGRWRLYAFAGANDHLRRARAASARCAGSWRSRRIRRCAGSRRPGQDIDAVFDLRAIFQQGHQRAGDRIAAGPAAAAQGAPRSASTTRRSSAPICRNGPDIFDAAWHRPGAGRPGGGAPGPVHRPRAAAGSASSAGGVLRRVHAGALRLGGQRSGRLRGAGRCVLTWRLLRQSAGSACPAPRSPATRRRRRAGSAAASCPGRRPGACP